MNIKKWLKENLERRPYNESRVSDGRFNYYHQEDVIALIESLEKVCNKTVEDRCGNCGSVCQCPHGPTCEFFDKDEECCLYGEI